MSEAYTGNLLDRREERAFPRQFQPRKMLVVVDDVVNDAEVNMVHGLTDRSPEFTRRFAPSKSGDHSVLLQNMNLTFFTSVAIDNPMSDV